MVNVVVQCKSGFLRIESLPWAEERRGLTEAQTEESYMYMKTISDSIRSCILP